MRNTKPSARDFSGEASSKNSGFQVRSRPSSPPRTAKGLPSALPNEILYEDNHLVVVNKLPSQIVQGDKTGDTSLADMVKEYIKAKYQKPGNVFLGIPHRIDRPTSGVVVYTRTEKALSRVAVSFAQRQVQKTYWAVVSDMPPQESGELVHYLKRNSATNRTTATTKPSAGRQEARMKYRVAGASDRYYLLEIELLTGRHHQIRAQLAAIGLPIKGDLKYGAPRSNRGGGIHLHARSLTIPHPITKEPITFVADPPTKDPLWNYFLNSQK